MCDSKFTIHDSQFTILNSRFSIHNSQLLNDNYQLTIINFFVLVPVLCSRSKFLFPLFLIFGVSVPHGDKMEGWHKWESFLYRYAINGFNDLWHELAQPLAIEEQLNK